VDGDTVIVRPGTYVENITFRGKAIVLKSEHGAHLTTIDGSQLAAPVSVINGETRASVLDGFTLTNGKSSYGGGVNIVESSPTIKNCIIRDNQATFHPGEGGGIACRGGSALIVNNVIFKNQSQFTGGGITCDHSTAEIVNNTISKNFVIQTFFGGGGLYARNDSVVTAVNNILWDNAAANGAEIYIHDQTSPATIDISYSDVKGGEAMAFVDPACTLNWGAGMLDTFPLFAEPDAGDFHISYISPCLNAGDDAAANLPGADFEGDDRIVGKGIDIGADEFTTHLYCVGNVIPGGNISIRIVGLPQLTAVTLVQGSGIKDPPGTSPYGDIYIDRPYLNAWKLGSMPNSGIKRVPETVPAGWIAGDTFYYQALVGPTGGAFTTTSNLMILIVQ
jgi:hypothetical protein